MTVNWYRFKATWRRRWASYVASAVLIGLVGGLALASVAAARRTDSAFRRFLRAGNPSDLAVDTGPYNAGLVHAVSQLPDVTSARSYVAFEVAPMRPDGRADFATLANAEAVGSVDGLYFDQDRFAVTRGRRASPGRADEMMVSENAARADHLQVGQSFDLGVFSDDQKQDPGFATGRVAPHLVIHATLVGVGVFNDEVVQDEFDRGARILLTPAFTAQALRYATYTWTGLRLHRGAADVAAVKRRFVALLPPNAPHFFRETSVTEAQAQRSIRPEATALGVFGLIAALAVLLIGGQAVTRAVRRDRDDLPGLRALGATPVTTGTAGLAGAVVVIAAGTLLALVTAVAVSPLAPIGAVRRVEVQRGLSFDWSVLVLGSAVLALALTATAAVVSARQAPHRELARSAGQIRRPSMLTSALASSGAPASAVAGSRMALETGSGRTAAPVRPVIVGAVVAMVTLSASLVFGNSLLALVQNPAFYGWDFDAAVVAHGGYGNLDGGQLHRVLDHNPDVEAWSGYFFGSIELDGHNVAVLGQTPGSSVSPPVTSGRGLQAADEVVLGEATLRSLHRHVGDLVGLGTGGAPQKLRVVGTATMPTIGIVHGTHPSLGSGAIIAFDKVPGYARNAQPGAYIGPNAVFVRFRRGHSAAGMQELNREFSTFGVITSQSVQIFAVQRPAEIVNSRAMGAAPAAMGGALAVAATLSLGLALGGSVRRRRRDLAMMKVLGFTSGQLAATIVWQATIVAGVGLVVGMPVGIAAGRTLWDRFAQELHVVPRPSVPFVELALVVVGGLVVANLVAAWPGRMASRTRAAVALRAE